MQGILKKEERKVLKQGKRERQLTLIKYKRDTSHHFNQLKRKIDEVIEQKERDEVEQAKNQQVAPEHPAVHHSGGLFRQFQGSEQEFAYLRDQGEQADFAPIVAADEHNEGGRNFKDPVESSRQYEHSHRQMGRSLSRSDSTNYLKKGV
jgi:hypothetical protein